MQCHLFAIVLATTFQLTVFFKHRTTIWIGARTLHFKVPINAKNFKANQRKWPQIGTLKLRPKNSHPD